MARDKFSMSTNRIFMNLVNHIKELTSSGDTRGVPPPDQFHMLQRTASVN